MPKILITVVLTFIVCFTHAQQEQEKSPKPMSWQDVSSWRYIAPFSVMFSADGNWVAYATVAAEGDGEITLRNIKTDSTKKYAIGGSQNPQMSFSENGEWFVYKEYPKFKDAKVASKTPGKQLFEKLCVINLSDFKKTVFDKTGRVSFNGKDESYLAIVLTSERTAGAAQTTGTDLLLYELKTGKKFSIYKIGDFSFNKKGDILAYTVNSANNEENGLFTMTLADRKITVIDNDTATYKSLQWADDKDALTVLKFIKDKNYKTEKGSVLGVKNLSGQPQLYRYNPSEDSLNFPKGMTVSPNRAPSWSEDLTKFFFGISPLLPVQKDPSQKEPVKDTSVAASVAKLEKIKADTSIHTLEDLKKAIAKTETPSTKPQEKGDTTKPDMVIWNWQDKRLQSVQQVREMADKNFSFSALYNINTKKFLQLSDSTMMNVRIFPKEQYALGVSDNGYQLESGLTGQSYSDLYIINLNTGDKKLFKEKFYTPSFTSTPNPSPDGRKFLYGYDGHYYVYNLDTQKEQNITDKIPTSFVDTEDDHNIIKPLTPAQGWSSDSRYLLINNLWDIWQVSADGSEAAVNLTQNGAVEKVRYPRRYNLYPDDKGIDLKKPQYFAVYGEWTKKAGIVRLDPARNGLKQGATRLIWADAAFNEFNKSKNADKYYFSKETFNTAPEYFVTDSKFSASKKVTENTPDKNKYTFSAGTRLVNYVTDKGDSLQGVIYLPAGYEEGKKYPTIVYYYEKTSSGMHRYVNPAFPGGGYNPTLFTSNGYAVFTPDIVYKLDDPGMSAVWAVIPAVKAAIATGITDPDRMGLQGHSWGGYQTAFLATQTNLFKAAAPGAALTDMISMYSLIYWNSGSGNMSIFEASQGRFRGAPWENWDSYLRNSPIYHVKKVQTPILMLHNDKDGAVDFTQGVEFYNALRRLQKPVVMIQYKGENHGLAKIENKKDYAVRMMEFFDHFLKGQPAPDWWSKGIDRLKMQEHLEARTF